MLTPVNGHLLIEPLKQEGFMATQKDTYQEIGIVIDKCVTLVNANDDAPYYPNKGDRIYFDSWLCAKFPKNDTEWYWLVKWEDVRAIESNETLPE